MLHPSQPLVFSLAAFVAGLLFSAAGAGGGTIYVDNVRGRDTYDGTAELPISAVVGPVRTLRRAALLAGPGGTIALADHGIPYEDTLELFGAQHSGRAHTPFTVLGNGAVLDGSCPVPREAWQSAGDGLWRFTPWRKGHYQLILDGRLVPEHPSPPGAAALPDVPPGHWSAWRGSIYLRPDVLEDPGQFAFRYACRGTGISLVDVDRVRIADLTLRHYRVDGLAVHWLSREIVLENVRCEGNGRAGVTAAGAAQLAVRGSVLEGNRRHSLLVLDRAEVEVDDQSALDAPPTLAD